MNRRIATVLLTALAAGLLVPTLAGAQYGTTTTTAPGGPVIVPPTIPSVTLPTVPGVTTTSFILPGGIALEQLLQGDIAGWLAQLRGSARREAAARLAKLADEIEALLASAGVDLGSITLVGGAILERGEEPNAPITLSFSADGFEAFAVVTFILESDPVLLGTAEANEGGQVSGTFEVPADLEPGEHTLTGIGTGADGQPFLSRQTVVVPEPEQGQPVQAAPSEDEDDNSRGLGFLILGLAVAAALIAAIVIGRGAKKTKATAESDA